MSRAVKSLMIDSIRRELADCREVIVLDVSKLDGVASNQLRLALRKKNIRMLGVKNAVAKKACREFGLTGIEHSLVGASTLAFGGDDIVFLSRELVQWTDKIKLLEIRGGAIGETPLNNTDVNTLSKSPGRRELLGHVVSSIISQAGRVSSMVSAIGSRLAGQVKMLADRIE